MNEKMLQMNDNHDSVISSRWKIFLRDQRTHYETHDARQTREIYSIELYGDNGHMMDLDYWSQARRESDFNLLKKENGL